MNEQQLLSLLDNVVSLAILAYFALYFRSRHDALLDRYLTHLERHESEKKVSEESE